MQHVSHCLIFIKLLFLSSLLSLQCTERNKRLNYLMLTQVFFLDGEMWDFFPVQFELFVTHFNAFVIYKHCKFIIL